MSMRGAARAGSDAACVRSRGTRAIQTPRWIDAPSLVRVVSERPSLLKRGFKLVRGGRKPLEPTPWVIRFGINDGMTRELTV